MRTRVEGKPVEVEQLHRMNASVRVKARPGGEVCLEITIPLDLLDDTRALKQALQEERQTVKELRAELRKLRSTRQDDPE